MNNYRMDTEQELLCKKLFTVISDFHPKTVKLSFAPDQDQITTPFFIAKNFTEIEIICFKSTLVNVFIETHKIVFQEKNLKKNYIENQELRDKLFYCCTGLLLTTPENKTILCLFEKLVIIFLDSLPTGEKENFFLRILNFCIRLLSSTSNKLNKSSSLWLFYKKLYIININKFSEIKDFDYFATIEKSATIHFANYYCWNTARWFFDICENTNEKRGHIIERTINFCFKHIRDISAWNFLVYILNNQHSISHKQSLVEFYHLSNRYNFSYIVSNKNNTTLPEPETQAICLRVLNFIDSFEIYEWPPFFFLSELYKLRDDICIDPKILEEWNNDVRKYETEHGIIETKSRNMKRIGPSKVLDTTIDINTESRLNHLRLKKYLISNLI